MEEQRKGQPESQEIPSQLSLKEEMPTPGSKSSRISGLAIAGIIVGAVFIFGLTFLIRTSLTVYGELREGEKHHLCLDKVRQVSRAMDMYASDHDGFYPPPSTWNDSLRPYFEYNREHAFRCPEDESGQASYAMNGRLDGLRVRDIAFPDKIVMVFESVPGDNQHGEAELLPPVPRHRHGHVVAFVDGHVSTHPQAGMEHANWDPTTIDP